jgi:hypothetical protein
MVPSQEHNTNSDSRQRAAKSNQVLNDSVCIWSSVTIIPQENERVPWLRINLPHERLQWDKAAMNISDSVRHICILNESQS